MIANVSEPAVEVIDGEMAKLGGEVTRRPVAEVMDELEAAEEAARRCSGSAARDAREPQGRPERQLRRPRREAEGEAPRVLTTLDCPSPASRRAQRAARREGSSVMQAVRKADDRG